MKSASGGRNINCCRTEEEPLRRYLFKARLQKEMPRLFGGEKMDRRFNQVAVGTLIT